jgi:hypothetical protein
MPLLVRRAFARRTSSRGGRRAPAHARRQVRPARADDGNQPLSAPRSGARPSKPSRSRSAAARRCTGAELSGPLRTRTPSLGFRLGTRAHMPPRMFAPGYRARRHRNLPVVMRRIKRDVGTGQWEPGRMVVITVVQRCAAISARSGRAALRQQGILRNCSVDNRPAAISAIFARHSVPLRT